MSLYTIKNVYRVFSGQEPPCPVVGVLTAGLQMEVIKAPVLQLLAEILDTHLALQCIKHCWASYFISPYLPVLVYSAVHSERTKDN